MDVRNAPHAADMSRCVLDSSMSLDDHRSDGGGMDPGRVAAATGVSWLLTVGSAAARAEAALAECSMDEAKRGAAVEDRERRVAGICANEREMSVRREAGA